VYCVIIIIIVKWLCIVCVLSIDKWWYYYDIDIDIIIIIIIIMLYLLILLMILCVLYIVLMCAMSLPNTAYNSARAAPPLQNAPPFMILLLCCVMCITIVPFLVLVMCVMMCVLCVCVLCVLCDVTILCIDYCVDIDYYNCGNVVYFVVCVDMAM